MRDEIDGRLWVEHGAAFYDQALQLFRDLGRSWRRLQAIKFDAPWRRSRVSRCA